MPYMGIKKLFLFVLSVCAILVTSASVSFAQIPVTARYFGQITSGESGITITSGDLIQIVYDDNKTDIFGQGAIDDGAGNFNFTVTVDSTFGNPLATMLYRKANKIYFLAPEDNNTFSFPFFATPAGTATELNLVIKDLFLTAGGSGGSTGSFAADGFDVDGSGDFSRADIDAIAEAVGRGSREAKYDVNGDGIANTRDIISAIKEYQRLLFRSRIQAQ